MMSNEIKMYNHVRNLLCGNNLAKLISTQIIIKKISGNAFGFWGGKKSSAIPTRTKYNSFELNDSG
jgi:hypothetical protein